MKRSAVVTALVSLGTFVTLVGVAPSAIANTGTYKTCNWHGIAMSTSTSMASLNRSCDNVRARIDRYVSSYPTTYVSEWGQLKVVEASNGTNAGNKGQAKDGGTNSNWFTVVGS